MHHTGEFACLSVKLAFEGAKKVVFHLFCFRAVWSILELNGIVMPPSEQFSSNASKSPHSPHQYYCNSLALGYLAAAVSHWQIPFSMSSLSPQPKIH